MDDANQNIFRILICDDEPSIHEDYKYILTPEVSSASKELAEFGADLFLEPDSSGINFRFSLLHAYQGREGLEIVKNSVKKSEPISLAFIDSRMPPGIDGIETIKKIWAQDSGMEIVLSTAFNDFSWSYIIEQFGYTDKLLFIRKPFDEVTLRLMAVNLTNKWLADMKKKKNLKVIRNKMKHQSKELNQAINTLLVSEEESAAAHHQVQKAKAELEKLAEQLIQMEKLTGLGELMASIIHEIKQPMNVIKILCQSILRDIDKNRFSMDDLKQDVPEIIQQVNRMAEITDHMRRYSRTTNGNYYESFDVNKAVDNSVKLVRQQFQNNNIEIKTDPASGLGYINGDPIRLEQVILNLIRNAQHALTDSSIKEKCIQISTRPSEDGKFVRVRIQDNGPGIPKHLREKIFGAFFTTKDAAHGTGLGLSISKKIAEQYGGSLGLDSEYASGAAFVLKLPFSTD